MKITMSFKCQLHALALLESKDVLVKIDVETVDTDEISGCRASAVDETISETLVLGPIHSWHRYWSE